MREKWGGGRKKEGTREELGKRQRNYFTYLGGDKREPCLILHPPSISFYRHENWDPRGEAISPRVTLRV